MKAEREKGEVIPPIWLCIDRYRDARSKELRDETYGTVEIAKMDTIKADRREFM